MEPFDDLIYLVAASGIPVAGRRRAGRMTKYPCSQPPVGLGVVGGGGAAAAGRCGKLWVENAGGSSAAVAAAAVVVLCGGTLCEKTMRKPPAPWA